MCLIHGARQRTSSHVDYQQTPLESSALRPDFVPRQQDGEPRTGAHNRVTCRVPFQSL